MKFCRKDKLKMLSYICFILFVSSFYKNFYRKMILALIVNIYRNSCIIISEDIYINILQEKNDNKRVQK